MGVAVLLAVSPARANDPGVGGLVAEAEAERAMRQRDAALDMALDLAAGAVGMDAAAFQVWYALDTARMVFVGRG